MTTASETNSLFDDTPFTPDEIDDVRIILKAKGKNYSIAPIIDKEEAK